MESTSGFTGSEPNKSENEKGDKKNKRSYAVSRPDLALSFSYQQREVPPPQREAMGRALLDGVVFMRPAGEKPVDKSSEKDKKEKKTGKPTFDEIMQQSGFSNEFVAATTKEGTSPKAESAAPLPKHEEVSAERPEGSKDSAADNAAASEAARFEDMMKQSGFGNEFVESASDDTTSNDATFIRHKPAPHLPPSADVPQNHTPLETPVTPAGHEMQSDDDAFRRIIQAQGARDPGAVRHHDVEPGYAPVTLAGFGEGGGGEPPHHFENAGESSPDEPDGPTNAMAPAGNVLRPGGLAGIGALEAQRRIDSLRHRAAEMGLAGGVAVLGLLLVGEHITAKRRDKKQQKQINTLRKDVKAQGQQIQQEQFAHQQTRTNLDKLSAEHAATAERLRAVAAQPPPQERAPLAAAAFAGAEFARPYSQETPLQAASPNNQAGAERFATQPGTKPEQAVAAEKVAEERAEAAQDESQQLQEGEHRVRESWYDAIVDREGRVVEGAIAYGQGMQQERRSEQLRDRTADTPQQPSGAATGTGDATQSQGVAAAGAAPSYDDMYRLPTYSGPALLSGMTSQSLPPGHPTHGDAQHLLMPPKPNGIAATLKKPWLWVFVGLLLLAFFISSIVG
jgi:hypothetical protein